jgi:hypothetical protein
MSEIIRLELKYCEHCGGLLLRRAGVNVNLCRSCERVQRDLPPRRANSHAPRPDTGAVVLPFRPASVPVGDVQACCEGEQA